MIIALIGDRFELKEPDNFKALKLVADAAPPNDLIECQLGRIEGDHVWVGEFWFMEQPPATNDAWLNSFRQMKEYAAGQGWVDPSGAIRVHIELSQPARDRQDSFKAGGPTLGEQ